LAASPNLNTHQHRVPAAALIDALHRNPLVGARPVGPDEDAIEPGLTRD